MGTNLHDVYYCQFNYTQEISDRMYDRNLASQQLLPSYFARPEKTRQQHMNVYNVNKSKTDKISLPNFRIETTFTPGQRAPVNGYSVDTETKLFNAYMPLQKCSQNKYIPDSTSSLYDNNYLTRNHIIKNEYNPHILIQPNEKFDFHNPNINNLGRNIFNNDIRQQIKNVNCN